MFTASDKHGAQLQGNAFHVASPRKDIIMKWFFIGILFMDVRSSDGILNLRCSSDDYGKPNMSRISQHMET
ncbi:hypothetical protein MTR67_026757 [Solanum verrucosum]|uniref:Uncharacterized protein n=1 Tax=Solanum verrucosum TaxID=315347 RepID=A0AAF0QZJ7_SOLVR|nr:hypothetical protein MTR67_026757 [Solanum verrucosum]